MTDKMSKAGYPMMKKYLKKMGHLLTVFITVLSLFVQTSSATEPTPVPSAFNYNRNPGIVARTPLYNNTKHYRSLEEDGEDYVEFALDNSLITDDPVFNPTGENRDLGVFSGNNCPISFNDSLPLNPLQRSGISNLSRSIAGFSPPPSLQDDLACVPPTVRNNSNVGRFCACVSGKSNPNVLTGDLPSSLYTKSFSREDSRNICENIVSNGVVSKFTKAVEKYAHSTVVSELLKVAGLEGAVCNAESMKQRFDKYSFDASQTNLRECSSQSLAYLVNQVESSAAQCNSSSFTSIFLNSCSIPASVVGAVTSNHRGDDSTHPQVREQDRQRRIQRQQRMDELLARTRALEAPAAAEGNVTQADIDAFFAANPQEKEKRDNLRAEYEEFINQSTLEDSFSNLIQEKVDASLESTFSTSDLTAIAQDPNKKRKALLGILNYIKDMPEDDPERKGLGGYPSTVVGLPTFAQVTSGAELSDEQVDILLGHYQGKTVNKCAETTGDFSTSCKMLTPGSLFDISEARSLAQRKPHLVDQGIIGSDLNVDNWLDLINKVQFQDRSQSVQMQSLMCSIHYDHGGLRTHDAVAFNRLADEENGEGSWIAGDFSDRGYRNSLFLGPDHEQVLSQFDNCSPFSESGQGSESRLLYDEYRALPYDLDKANVISTNDQNRSNALETNTDAGTMRRNLSRFDSGGFDSNSSSENSASNGSIAGLGSGSGMDEIRENTRQELANNPRQVSSAAADFYNSMDERNLQATTSSFITDYSNRNSSVTSAVQTVEEIDAANAQEALDSTQRALRANDALLRQLADLEKRNTELKERLDDMNISTIEDGDGNTVSVADAFNRTKQRIEDQRAQAMQEREALAERERIAQSFVNPSNSSDRLVNDNTNRNFDSNSDSSNNISSRVSGSSSSGGVSNVNSSSFNAPSVNSSSTGSSSFDATNYGPIPYSGITLSVDDLSIAKPQLDLGGRSLTESADLVRAAISEVQSVFRGRDSSLPAYTIDGKAITEYIVQEQDGRDVIVYLDGDEVKVQPIDLATTQAVATEETEVVEEEVVDRAPASVTPVIESAGRKDIDALNYSWDFVEQTLDESQNAD